MSPPALSPHFAAAPSPGTYFTSVAIGTGPTARSCSRSGASGWCGRASAPAPTRCCVAAGGGEAAGAGPSLLREPHVFRARTLSGPHPPWPAPPWPATQPLPLPARRSPSRPFQSVRRAVSVFLIYLPGRLVRKIDTAAAAAAVPAYRAQNRGAAAVPGPCGRVPMRRIAPVLRAARPAGAYRGSLERIDKCRSPPPPLLPLSTPWFSCQPLSSLSLSIPPPTPAPPPPPRAGDTGR